MRKRFNVKITKTGFTLMEAIVAITIITVGIVGVFSLVTQTISSVSVSEDKLIAAYLAQEGIEIVRNIRDTNWIENESTWVGLDAGIYEVDYDAQFLSDYTGTPLNLETATNYYGYGAGNSTKFTRKITITQFGNYINVVVLVEWEEKGKSYNVTAQENLYDWY